MQFRVSIASVFVLAFTGCHNVCGQPRPLWVAQDCAVEPALPDATLDECDVMIEVLVNGETEWELSDGSVVVDAIVSNVSGELLELALEEPCPDDIVSFTGLGEGYDYYGSCAAGDCATSGERVLWTLEAEESLSLYTTVTVGGDSCNEALPSGDYVISADLPLLPEDSSAICALPARLVIP